MRGDVWRIIASLVVAVACFRVSGKVVRGGHYKSPVPEDECRFTLELMMIVDASASHADDFVILSKKAESLLGKITEAFPESRVGFATFVDKPMKRNEGAWCYRTDAPLGSTPLEIAEQIKEVPVGGGGDQAENLFGAMIRSAMSPLTGWSAKQIEKRSGLPIVKLMVTLTNAMPHTSDYFSRVKQTYDQPVEASAIPTYPAAFSKVVTPQSLANGDDVGCFSTEYPSFSEWASSLKKYNILPLMLAGNWTYEAHGKLYYPIEYLRFAMNQDHQDWGNTFTGLEAFFADMLAENDLDGFVHSIASGLDDLEKFILGDLNDSLVDIVC